MRGNSIAKGAVLALVIVLLLLPIAAACARAPAKAPAGPPIKIGTVYSLTGSMNIYGPPSIAAVELAINDINAKGGVLGRKFEIINKDDQSKPDEGVRVVTELIVRDKVNFLMGPISSAVALAMSGVAKENKILQISTNARTNALTFEKGHRYFLQMATPAIVLARNAATYTSKQPWKRIFTTASDFEFGQTVVKDYVTHLKKLRPDVEIVGQSWPPLTATDFSAYITQIVQAKPDAVYEAIVGAPEISFMKQAKAYGLFDKVPFVNAGGYAIENKMALGKEAPANIVGSFSYEFNIDNPRNKAYAKAMLDKTGQYPGHVPSFAYEGVYFLAEAIKMAGSTDTEKVIAAFETGKVTRDTVVGKVTIRPYDHQATWIEMMGVHKFVPEYPFPVFQPFKEQYPVDQIFPSVEEVKKARGEK